VPLGLEKFLGRIFEDLWYMTCRVLKSDPMVYGLQPCKIGGVDVATERRVGQQSYPQPKIT
jgi:hypothetical protein